MSNVYRKVPVFAGYAHRMRHKEELERRRAEMDREREEILARQAQAKRLQVCTSSIRPKFDFSLAPSLRNQYCIYAFNDGICTGGGTCQAARGDAAAA